MKENNQIYPSKKRLVILLLVLILPVILLLSLGNTDFAAAILWIEAVLVFLVLGNLFIHQKLEKLQPWDHIPLRRFLSQFILSGIYSLACINICYYSLKTLLIGRPPSSDQFLVLNIYGLLFFIPIISLVFGLYFMQRWKAAVRKSEQLQAENLKTRLETLKGHIDPHFLFNNLNVLSSLIDMENEEAQRFLDKFAEVYRYVLQHREEELVELEVEVAFISSYMYLFQKRLDRQLKIAVHYSGGNKALYIPTLSLQMLVENAIKHNIASALRPLKIEINCEQDQYITVRNTYQPKVKAPSELPQSGLDNIRKRLAYFTEKQVILIQNEDFFEVKIPLIEMETKS